MGGGTAQKNGGGELNKKKLAKTKNKNEQHKTKTNTYKNNK